MVLLNLYFYNYINLIVLNIIGLAFYHHINLVLLILWF